MKIRPRTARHAIVATLLTICAACGGQPPKDNPQVAEATPSGNYYIGTRPIYAHLASNKDGSWVFRAVTASDEPPEAGFLVRLNDLTPAFDTRVAECTPQVYPESHRCNPANPFRDEESGVLDKIINGSIAVGTAGKIKDITYSYETTFDETRFNRAVDEALLNTGLDHRRLISLVATYEEELRDARAELQTASERMQAAQASSGGPVLDIQPTVSGLVEYYQGDIDFTQLVDLEAADDSSTEVIELKPTAILPCEVRTCVATAESALASLRYDLNTNMEHVAAGTRPRSRLYTVRCDMVSYASYRLQAECPTTVIANGDQPVRLPIHVTILSRDFDNLYPPFGFGDSELRVGMDGEKVTFSNLTDEFITVSAQTVYYNSTVNTTAVRIDLPPGVTIVRDVDEFVSTVIDIESTYLQMTPDKASGASFQFGFAVRYQLASRPEERTLHDVDSFNVGCVISNRIRPGSCQPEAVADASATQPADRPADSPHGPM